MAGALVRLADGERRQGEDIRLTTPVATCQAGRGLLERRGRVLTLLPPPQEGVAKPREREYVILRERPRGT